MAHELAFDILGDIASLASDPKPTEDLSTAAKNAIETTDENLQSGTKTLEEIIDYLLIIEKKCRQACDATAASLLCCKILMIFKEKLLWSNVMEYIIILSKKRGQLKRVIIDIVRLAMNWLEDTPTREIKLTLADTLSKITEGKIFVEVERARLIKNIAHMKEAEGNIDEAVTLLHDVQVETFGTMDRREKFEYILDQMRLLLLKNDFIRMRIMSRKINSKLLDAEEFEDLKLQFNNFLIQYFLHEKEYLSICKCYFSVYQTSRIQNVEEDCKLALQNYVFFLLLAPFDNEQNDLLLKLRTTEKAKLDLLPAFRQLVDDFLKDELMMWPLSYVDDFQNQTILEDPIHSNCWDERINVLHKRVLQHNIRVIGKYYTRISLSRLSSLLRVSTDVVESEISELVSSGFLLAKMDRPAGHIKFGKKKQATDYLNQWGEAVGSIIDKIEESSHLIQKEKMIMEALTKREEIMKRNKGV